MNVPMDQNEPKKNAGKLCSRRFVGQISRLLYLRGQFITYEQDEPAIKKRQWKNYPFNFDDIGKAMLTLCTVSTFEGWPLYELSLWSRFP